MTSSIEIDPYDWTTHLEKEERVLWQGWPDGRLFVFRPIELILIPFSLAWTAFVVAGVGNSLQSLDILAVFAVFFLCTGVYALVGRFFNDQYIRRHTFYALTTKRALIAKHAFGHSVLERAVAPGTSVNDKDGSLGRIAFGSAVSPFAPGAGLTFWGVEDASFRFRAATDAAQVYDTAKAIKRGNSP